MEANEVLTVTEAALLLSLSPYTVRELARDGNLPARKVGKEWRFVRSQLLSWLSKTERNDPAGEDHSWLTADLSRLGEVEPYPWGEGGALPGQPVRYVPGRGLIVEGGKDRQRRGAVSHDE